MKYFIDGTACQLDEQEERQAQRQARRTRGEASAEASAARKLETQTIASASTLWWAN